VALPAAARADTTDDAFMNAITAQGIPGARDQLIADAHQACDAQGPGIVGLSYQLMGQGLTSSQAANVILDGYRAYCPEKSGGIPPP